MTAADPNPVGLDPAHVLAICTRATGSDAGIQVTGTEDGIRLSLSSRRAAWTAATALGRVGYTVAHDSADRRTRDLIVTGWNAGRLDSRLTALRTVMHRLADNPLVTATAAVRGFAALPVETSTSAAASVLDETRQKLRDWVDARAGICPPAPPSRVPANAAIARRIRAATSCEEVISDLIDRHVRVAEHAVNLFASLRHQMNGGRAERTAVRRAGIFFHLSSDSIAQDSTPLMNRSAPRARPSGTAASPRSRSGRPRRGMSGEFPAPPGAAGPPGTDPPAGRAGPGGQDFPAARPGRHR